MISAAEAGLSQSDYDALFAATTKPNFSITAHRWNPDFGDAAWVTGSQSNVGDDWDAVSDGTYIYRVWGHGTTDFGFHRINIDTGVIDEELGSVFKPGDVEINTRYRVSLSDTPGTIYLYANGSTGLLRRQLDDFGATLNPWTYIISSISSVDRLSENQFRNGTADASSFNNYEHGPYVADNAFDNNRETHWSTSIGTATGWLRYQLPSAVALTRYDMYCHAAGSPKTWTFEGSNDGTIWTTLDTQTAVADWSDEWRTFTFTNSTAYLYYRMDVTARQTGISQVLIPELRGYYIDENIAAIDDFAVPQWDSIHFTFLDETTQTYQLRKARYGGVTFGWDIAESDIYLTFRPNAIEAVSILDPNDNDSDDPYLDIVTLNTEVPGVEKIVAESNTPVRYIANSGGLLSFWVRGNHGGAPSYTWSEHFEIDVLAESNENNFRNYARLSLIDGTIYLTSYSSDGVSQYTNLGCRIYSTKEGRFWSLGNMLPVEAGEYAIKLIQEGDYLFAVERGKIWRSYSTLQFGHSPAALQMDLTPYVMEYTTDNSSMFSASFTLGNDTATFTDHDWFNENNVIALEHRTGYYVGTGFLDYPLAITEVDALDFSEQVPEQFVRVVARDHLAWMTDKFKSENAKYWNSLRAVGDNYLDKTETNYGGLSHSAIQDGRWETEDGELICKQEITNGTPSGRGLIFASDPSNIWNGVVQVAFKMEDALHARAGIVFRAYDYYNRWMVYYHPTADEIHLEYWHGQEGAIDEEEDLAVEGSIGWTNVDTTWHYLKVKFYYGKISVWHSDDGTTWISTFEYITPTHIRQMGAPYLKKLDHVMKERGYVGLWAQTHDTVETKFKDLRIYEMGNLHIVENAFQAYAGLAGIHDTQFDTLPYSADTDDWDVNDGLLNIFELADFDLGEGIGIRLLSGSDPSIWQTAISTFDLPSHNVVIRTLLASDGEEEFGIVVRALDDGSCYIAGRDEDGDIAIIHFDGVSTYTPVFKEATDIKLYHMDVTVSFQEVHTGSDSDTFWHVISMWWNDKLVATYIEDYGSSPISGSVSWGIATRDTSNPLFARPRLPELNVISDWTTLDPGEAPMSALSRAIEGLNLRFFIRYDGRLYAWKPKAKSEVYEYANKSRMSDYSNGFDQRKLRTAVRVVGGYSEATYHDKDLIKKYEYRFAEVNNPFILTHDEAYREAQLVLMRMLEQATQTQFSHPHTPFLEPEDRVETPSGSRLVTGVSVQYTGPIHNQMLALRGYPYGEPE